MKKIYQKEKGIAKRKIALRFPCDGEVAIVVGSRDIAIFPSV